MLKVLGRATSSNVQKVMWALEELDIAYEREDLGGAFGGLDTPEYIALNPNKVIPTLVDGDQVIWESNTIVRYIAAKHDDGGLWPSDPAARAQADKWMDWQLSTLLMPWINVFFGVYRTPGAVSGMPTRMPLPSKNWVGSMVCWTGTWKAAPMLPATA